MSFEEYKSDVSSERSTPESHGSRGKENGASTQICGFEVSRASRPGIRLSKQGELSGFVPFLQIAGAHNLQSYQFYISFM